MHVESLPDHTMFTQLTPADRLQEKLREVHFSLVSDARDKGLTEEDLPAWHIHLPSGQRFQIRLIGTCGPLMRFIGLDGDAVALVAPESVAITLTPIPAESTEERVTIGFA